MKTRFLIGLLILAVIVLVSVYVQTIRKSKECYGEGEIFDKITEPDALCCPGLTQRFVYWPDEPIGKEDKCIAALAGKRVCTKCGDGKCGPGENWCICTEDCPKPKEVPCRANIDCGRDFCEQDKNVCYETIYVCANGNCSQTTKEYKNYVCVEDRCVKELELPQNIFVCTEKCATLPVVEFKVCPTNEDCATTKEAYLEFYLDGMPLQTFVIAPQIVFSGTKIYSSAVKEKIILESGPVFYPYRDQQIFRINGAYKVRFKFSDYVKNDLFLSYLDKKLFPGQLLKIDLISTKEESAEGIVYLYQQSDAELNLTVSELYGLTKEIHSNYFRVTGKSSEYKAFTEPDTLARVSGEDGNFYWGHGKLQILYSPHYMNATKIKEVVVAEFAHEYGHAIEPHTVCYLVEGLIDGLAFHLGYKKFDWRKENAVECTQFIANKHLFGRCVFHHLYVNGIFSDSFFNKVFNPTKQYVFKKDCILITDPDTANTYNEMLSDAAGQDLTSILIDMGVNVTAD